MPAEFQPNLSTLDRPQRRLWDELSQIPPDFSLCGGTAVALHLGHRASVDFDFISAASFDPDELYETLSFLREGVVVQKGARMLTCIVDRGGAVKLSFFGVPNVRLINEPRRVNGNQLRVASLLDLAGMKAAVVQKRAEAKDYIDLDAIIQNGKVDLPAALSAGKRLYGAVFNPELTLKSLCFFDEGDLPSLPADIRNRLLIAVKAVDLSNLPTIPSRSADLMEG